VARSPQLLQYIREQVESLHKRWDDWYSPDSGCSSFQTVRYAKLARVLRFYADKAHRHHLLSDSYSALIVEINRMIEKGGGYSFDKIDKGNRGWIFCPEYNGANPMEISPSEWDTRIFLFGPCFLPDSTFARETTEPTPHARDAIINPSLLEEPCISESDRKQTATDLTEIDSYRQSDKCTSQSHDKTAIADDIVPSICLGADILSGSKVKWPLTIKGNPHLLMAGLPGMGKTTCLLNLCKQMLAADVRPIVFSYHQDIDEKLEQLEESVRFIDFHGLGFNPLQVMNRNSRLAYLDVAGALRDIFTAIYPELGDIQGERIRKAIKESFVEVGWDDPNVDLSQVQEPEFKRFVEILRDVPKPDRGLRSLLGRLEELDDYGFFNTNVAHESLWKSDEPIVIRIHSTQNDNLQKAFASLVFYSLYKDMFRRGVQSRITHAIIFDEAHRAAGLKLIPTMAKECRKYGISLILASQEAKDFNISLFSAIANYLVLRLTETDAKALVRNAANSLQERMLIDKIKQMERFRALYFCEGKRKPSPIKLLP